MKVQPDYRNPSVQALIHCQRYDDAAQKCQDLLPGVDKLYLQAEIAWRSGQLKPCLEYLHKCSDTGSTAPKCKSLSAKAYRLLQIEETCTDAAEEGK